MIIYVGIRTFIYPIDEGRSISIFNNIVVVSNRIQEMAVEIDVDLLK